MKIFTEKFYLKMFYEKQTTSISAQCYHYVKTGPMIFTVNQWASVFLMVIMGWNQLSETHGNLAGFSRSGHRVSLSKWRHNLNWMYLRHSYCVKDAIWTSYACSVYNITTEIPLSHNSPELWMGSFKLINI